MRAVIIPEHGAADVLRYVEDFEEPQPGPSEALVRIHATGVNQIDRVVRMGYPGIGISLPHIPGGDIAGVVERAATDGSGPGAGTRVLAWPMVACGSCALCAEGKPNLCQRWSYFGLHRRGSYAEYQAVPAINLVELPQSLSFEDAVGLPIAGMTALHALQTVGGLQKRQSFFIWGGSGALGTLAVQIARELGATVLATVGSDEKAERLRALGVEHVFNRKSDDVPARVMEVCPAGVDLALDYVGPQTFDTTLGLLKKGGSMLLCGMLSGRETNFSIQQAYLKHVSVKGLYLGTREELQQLTNWFAEGRVKAVTDSVFPLAEAARAHERLESGEAFGKIVLRL